MKFKRKVKFFLGVTALLLMGVGSSSLSADASGVDNITARSDYMYNTLWIPQTNVNGWVDGSNYYFADGTKWSGTFYCGNRYHIPYGQPITAGEYIGYGIAVADFVAATKNVENPFYTTASYNQYNMPSKSTYYANDCSAFVSYCWDLPSRKTTYDWSGLNVTSLGNCNMTNIPKIEQGDAICQSAHHIVLVSRVNDNGSYEITEQTPPEIKRTTCSAQQLASKYKNYTIYRYNARDDVPPPSTESEIPPPTTATLDTAGNQKTFALGNIIIFNAGSDTATGYTINIFKDAELIFTDEFNTSTYHYKPTEKGSYFAYIVANNDNGALQSETISFDVYNGVPSNVQLTATKEIYDIYENIQLDFSAEDSLYYVINIYNESGLLWATQTTSDHRYIVNSDAVGQYFATITAYNEIGSVMSEIVTFRITDDPAAARIAGDVTSDNALDIHDVYLLRDYLHNRTTFTETEYAIADMNGDGVINVLDLALLKRKIESP